MNSNNLTINTIESLFPLNAEQNTQLTNLLQSLNADQTLWLAGYLAGYSASRQENRTSEQLTILYGSMTGNAEDLAKLAAEKASRLGFQPIIKSISECDAQDLPKLGRLLLIVSTYGDGAPATPAKELHRQLFGPDAPELDKLAYAVLALGDSTYPLFCQAGLDFDQQLEKLGAKRVQTLHLGDYDVAKTAPDWLDKTLPLFKNETESAVKPGFALVKPKKTKGPKSVLNIRDIRLPKSVKTTVLPSKSHPFPAPVLEKYNLHGPDSDRQTLHLVLKTDVPGMDFKPGDAAGVLPLNHPDLIREWLEVTGFDGQSTVRYQDTEGKLEDFLRRSVELSKITPDVVKKYRNLCTSEEFLQLADDKTALSNYLKGRDIIDLLTDFPVAEPNPENLLSVLRPLQPRYYSIASSPLEHPGELHLTVGVVAFEQAGRSRKGTCSSYLSDVRIENEHIPVFIEPNTHFRLPEDHSVPIVMISAGTGIAPFRAFVQHRAHSEQAGKSWLFFGNRYRESEFLYREEWEKHLQSGALTRLDTAFSRDGKEKRYVQHCLSENAAELYQWLDEGAHIYLCGDMNGFANDVQEALAQVVAEQGKMTIGEAETYLEELQNSKRFQMDVY